MSSSRRGGVRNPRTPERQKCSAQSTPRHSTMRTEAARETRAADLLDEAPLHFDLDSCGVSTPTRQNNTAAVPFMPEIDSATSKGCTPPPSRRSFEICHTPPSQREMCDALWLSPRHSLESCHTPPPRPSAICHTPSERGRSCSPDSRHEDQQCPICLESVDSVEPSPSFSLKPQRRAFKTACCQQIFHRACLAQYRECASDLAGCPLCRSTKETGLTPLETRSCRVRARTVAAAGGLDAMLARHAAARQAVAARVAAEAEERRRQMEEAAPFNELFDSDF
jgi:hypothetical protein